MTRYDRTEYECDRDGCAAREVVERGQFKGPDGWRRIWVLPPGKPDASTEIEGAYYVHLCEPCSGVVLDVMGSKRVPA